MESMLLLTGLGALFLAFVVAIIGLAPEQGRDAVARTVKRADESYRIARPASSAQRAFQLPNLLSGQARRVSRRLMPSAAFASLNRRLDQAGNPTWLGVDAALAYKGILLFAGAAVGMLLAVLLGGPLNFVLWILGGAAAGFFAPDLVVMHLAQERQEDIRRTLPDIMDTLVITVEAGLGFEAALAQVVRNGRGPIVGEFARVLHEMQIGRPRVEALRDMAVRTNVTELKAFASAVVQATTLGIPMGAVLRQQANEMRVRRRQRAEELAQRVPVKILFPMILCIFPALFVVILGPGIVRLLDVL